MELANLDSAAGTTCGFAVKGYMNYYYCKPGLGKYESGIALFACFHDESTRGGSGGKVLLLDMHGGLVPGQYCKALSSFTWTNFFCIVMNTLRRIWVTVKTIIF